MCLGEGGAGLGTLVLHKELLWSTRSQESLGMFE